MKSDFRNDLRESCIEISARLHGFLYHYRFALLWFGLILLCLRVLRRIQVYNQFPYTIRDFLINSAGGPVRRFLGGDISIALAEMIGARPAILAWLILSAATLGLAALVIRLYRALPDDTAYLPLILGPGGLLFLAYEFDGAFRKELFGYLAIALILNAAMAQRRGIFAFLTGLAALTFVVSIPFHEGNMFLWPAFALALALVGWGHPGRWAWLLGLAIFAGVAGGVLFWILSNLPPPDITAICDAAQIARCHWPFTFLTVDIHDGLAFVQFRRSFWHVTLYFFTAVLSLLPISFLHLKGVSRPFSILVRVLPVVAIAPLFFFAIDWARWVFMAAFPLNLLATSAILLGKARFENPMPKWATVLYLLGWRLPQNLYVLLQPAVVLPALALWVVMRSLGKQRA